MSPRRRAALLLAACGLLHQGAAFATVALSAEFNPNEIFQGERSRLIITFQNDQASTLNNAQFTHNLPTQLRLYTGPGMVAPSTTCTAGTVTGVPGATDQIQFTGGVIPAAPPAGQVTCTMSIDVTSTFNVGAGNSTTFSTTLDPTLYSDNINGSAAISVITASLLVKGLTPPTVGKTFGTSPLPQGNVSTVTITLRNPNTTVDMPLATPALVDNLPANLVYESGGATTCAGGTVSNTATSVTLNGGTIPVNGQCTLTFSVRGTLTPGTTTQGGSNAFAVGAIGNLRGLNSPAASTNITVNSPIRLEKGFSPSPLAIGNTSTMTLRIINDSSAALTGVNLDDTVVSGRWPSQVTISGAATTFTGCGGTLNAAGGGAGFTLTGASIAAGATCTIAFPVTSNTVSAGGTDWTNSIPENSVDNNEGFRAPAVSARLDVRNDALTVAKSVSPASASPGDILTFTVDVTTFSSTPQTGVAFTDNFNGNLSLVTSAVTGGIDPVLSGAGCTGLVPSGTAAAPTFTFNMPQAAAGGSVCTVKFTARVSNSLAPATVFTNSTGPVGNGAGGVAGASVATGNITVLQPFTVSKTFDGVTTRTLPAGTVTQLQIVLTNNNFSALSNVAFTDTLPNVPGQIRVANPANATSTCGGTVTANPGDTAVSLAGGNIAARSGTTPFAAGTCAIRVNVVGGTIGAPTAHVNNIAVNAVSATGEINGVVGATVRNTNATSASLQYTAALEADKSFLTNPVVAGGTSRVRIVLRNVGAGVLNNVSVTDPLTGSLVIAPTPNASSTCNGALTISAPAGGNTATLTGATLPPGSPTPSTCEFLFDVVSPGNGAVTNTIPAGNITADGGVSNTTAVTATLNKTTSSVQLTKSFTPTTISSPGQTSRLAINITNGAGVALTNLGVIDTMPAGMQVAAVPNTATTCAGGIVTGSAGATSVSLSGGSLAVGASCQVQVDVTTLNVGTLTNTLPANIITNTQGQSNASPFSANLSALASLGIAKSFTPPSVPPNTRARLNLVLNNTLAIPLNSISGTDNLPAGLQTAVPPNTSTTCAGATVSTTTNSITFSGASLPANNGSCRVEVDVIAPAVGAYENVIPGGTLVANGGGITNPPPGTRATLNVLNPPTVAKAFAAATVNPGQADRLTITINNPNTGTALTNVSLRDNLPAGLFVAPTPNASTTCTGGTVSAVPSASSAQVAGATIPANGSCTFAFDTVSNIAGLYTNTIPPSSVGTAEGVTNADPATAQVRVLMPPTLAKSFSPPSISPTTPASTSRLTITLGNANAAAQTLAQALDDLLPINVVVATPPNVVKTCPGTVTAAAGATTVTYASGATIPAGGCTIQVDVTSNVPGTYNNSIPAGALRTDLGSNTTPATATLVVSPLGTISGLIYRDDNNDGIRQAAEPIFAGETVQLLDSVGGVITTTTTDVNGNYSFSGLAAGTYGVRQPNQPAGTLAGKTTAGTISPAGVGTVGTASNPGVAPSTILTIVLNASGGNVASSPGNNFGEIVASEVSGKVYRDDNGNGTLNGSEPGIGGVTVTLSGLDDLGQTVQLTTTTAADGTYSFTGLRPSTAYSITEGTQPAGTANGGVNPGTVLSKTTSSAVGTAGTGSNNAPVAAPAPAGTSRIANINLPPNAVSANNNFGELASNRTISGRIFTDNNADGAVNGIDAGVGTGAAAPNNVAQTLNLTGTDLNGNAVTMTVTTDATGNYSFTNVPPGNAYTVTCTTCTPPAGFVNSPAPLAYPGTTGGTAGGTQAVPTITGINLAGTNTISVNNNFTKLPPGQLISGRVFFDANDNGVFNSPADFGISGQTIQLRDNGTNALVATTTTDANGYYSFSGFPAGTYRVVQPNQPTGTTDGKTRAGTVGGVAAGTATAQGTTPSMITGIVINAGQAGANYDFPETASASIGGRVYEDVDLSGTFNGGDNALAGVVMQLTGTDVLGNSVSRFAGTDVNGQYSFTGLVPGTYTVTENQPTNYTSVANTTGAITGGTAGSVGALGGTQETQTLTLTSPTGSAPNVNFSERISTGSIRGFKSVFNQTNPGKQPVPGDIVVWTISFKNESGATKPLQIEDILPAGLTRTGAPAITLSATGVVTGLALNAGYTGAGNNNLLQAGATFGNGAVVIITLPTVVTPAASGTISNQARATGTPAPVASSQVDNTTPSLPAGVSVPGNSLPQVAPTNNNPNNIVPTVVRVGTAPTTQATVSGYVWLDNNSDRVRDGSDTPMPNWGVAVYDAAGKFVPCTNSNAGDGGAGCTGDYFRTNADGFYSIKLDPGSYKLEFRDPESKIVYGTPMNSANDSSSRVSQARDALNITLTGGQNLLRQDLPLDPSGVVYDSTTRLPIKDAAVQFCGPAGFDPASMLIGGASYTLAGNCATMKTGSNGFYQYILTPSAPAGTYSLAVTAPSYIPSTLIQPSPGPYTPAGASPVRVQAQAGPPTGSQPTTYYLSFNLSPGVPDLIHNHIPMDPSNAGLLFLQKAVDRPTVELGDSVMYTLRLTSPNNAVVNARISDTLPAGFRLIPGTVILNNVRAPDPQGSPGPTLTFLVGTLPVGEIATITYRVRVGVGAQQGDGINRARAAANVGAMSVSSNEARAQVKITSGVFFEEACVVGKIFVDCNNNRIQDPEELGIPGVRFYFHDGTYLISDVEGKYSYCGLPARTSVIKADGSTLPVGSQLVTSSNRNALDANSLFLDLQMGGLHRADFIEGSCGPGVVEQVKARRAKGAVVSPTTEKKPQPKLIFESGSIRKSAPKEREEIMRSCPAGQCNAPQGNAATPAVGGEKGGAK